MKRTIFFVLLLTCSRLFAQGIQMNQTPLLYHPSFAGSTGGGRLAFSTFGFQERAFYDNQGNSVLPDPSANTLPSVYNKKSVLSSYLSYDHLIKGIGLGIALKNQNSFYLLEEVGRPFRKGTNTLFGVAIAMSPKFILKNGNGKTRYTLAPSLLVEYSKENSPFKSSLYSIGYNDSEPVLDTKQSYPKDVFGRWGYGFNNDGKLSSTYQATLGLMLNSSTAYVGISYQHTTALLNSNNIRYQYSGFDEQDRSYKEVRIDTLSKNMALSYSVVSMAMGHTIKRNANSKLSFSYQLYLAYGFPFNKNEVNFIQHASLNLTAVYGKMYLGIGASERPVRNVSLFAGYQSSAVRLGVSYGWKLEPKPMETNRAVVSLNATFFFPK